MLPISGYSQVDSIKPDALSKAVREMGLSTEDVGYKSKGYWTRYPQEVPYKFIAFDDLFAEPIKLYDYTKMMANAAEDYLNPEYIKNHTNLGLTQRFIFATDSLIKNEKICESVAYCGFLRKSYRLVMAMLFGD